MTRYIAIALIAILSAVEPAAGAEPVNIITYRDQSSSVRVEPALLKGRRGVALLFEGTDDLHYYADRNTAPGGYSLEIAVASRTLGFGKPVFPNAGSFYEKATRRNIAVYEGDFTVFIPIESQAEPVPPADVSVTISGIACTSQVCLSPFTKKLAAPLDFARSVEIKDTAFGGKPARPAPWAPYPVGIALALAFAAGLSLNVMPCVWPVLPLIIMRIAKQSHGSRTKSAALGLAFCAGIILFFACLAGANAALRLLYHTLLQWGDQFRNPVFVASMAVLLVILAEFCFGVFTIGIPASISGGGSSGTGYAGAAATGFLAAVLSTPCSFAILAAAFAWAQAQSLPLGTLAILVIGAGMAAPYAVLTSTPALSQRLPRPGRWMELFKQAVGFILLAVAIKLIAAVPQSHRTRVLYFAVAAAFCAWIWGGWVGYETARGRRWLFRAVAVALAVAAGWLLFAPAAADGIDWQPYDGGRLEEAVAAGRPVLVKFTAEWCLSCQVVDATVYKRAGIADLIRRKGVLAMRGDTTVSGQPATVDLKERFAEPGVPVSIFFTPAREEPARWRGLGFAGELQDLLEGLEDGG
jgi:thiol:disulfide interchange protein DsbD